MSGRMVVNKARLIPCCDTSTWITTYGVMEISIRFILLMSQASLLSQLKLSWDMNDLLHPFGSNGKTRDCPIGGLYNSKMDTLVATVINIIDLVMIFFLLGATRMRVVRLLKLWLVFAFGMTILCFVMAVAKNCSSAILLQLFHMAYMMVLASGVSSLVHEIEADHRKRGSRSGSGSNGGGGGGGIISRHRLGRHHHHHPPPHHRTSDDNSPNLLRGHQLTPHVITMSTLPMFPSSAYHNSGQPLYNHHDNGGHHHHTILFDDPAPPPPYEDFQPPSYAQISTMPMTQPVNAYGHHHLGLGYGLGLVHSEKKQIIAADVVGHKGGDGGS